MERHFIQGDFSMTNYIIMATSVVTADNGLLMADPYDTVIVAQGVTFGTSADARAGIASYANFQSVAVAGMVVGYVGVLLGQGGRLLHVQTGGSVTGTNDAVRITSDSGYVTNSGTIAGESAIHSLAETGTLSVTNSGTLQALNGCVVAEAALDLHNSGSLIAVSVAVVGNGESQITNTGLIDGAIFLSDFDDQLINTGMITQQILMGDGQDLVDSTGGRILGQVTLGTGNDTFIGGGFADIVTGRDGQDDIATGGGDDRILAQERDGNDDIDGGAGQDTYDARGVSLAVHASLITGRIRIGGNTDDVTGLERVWGGAARDVLSGDDLANGLAGGAGNDTLVGLRGADRLSGGLGADLLQGGDGNDRLLGGDNVDNLQGGAGDDVFFGGYDVDVYTGDAGADRFVWTDFEEFIAGTGGLERITDFTQGQDRIDLSAIDARFSITGDQGFVFKGTAALTDFGQLNYRTTANATFIAISMNSVDAFEVIRLDGVHALTAADFVL
jgi:Ca2+-binding RTX toxin-like protein